jgi:uncharacterized peroxidase-related enzyme
MPRVEPVSRESLAEFEPFFAMVEQVMGFVPNSMLTMGRSPDLLRAFGGLSAAVLVGSSLDPGLRQLIAFVSSNASGCRYCQAHTSHSAERAGVDAQKIESAFEYETSDLFTDAERAALRLAQYASLVPNEATDAHFDALREHFDEKQIVEIVAVISLFGWLNRWNDTMGTELEESPRGFAEEHLAERGWEVGRHGG